MKVSFPKLSKVQWTILQTPTRNALIRCGRRMGKTFAAAVAMIDGYGPRNPSGYPWYRGAMHGSKVWYVAPDYKQCRDIWNTITEWCPSCKVNKSERTIRYPNGGEIAFRVSAQCERLRGVGLDGLVCDEIADISPDTYFASLRPTLVDRKGWFWGMGTPQGAIGGNLMYDLETKAGKLPSWTIHHFPSVANPLLDPAEILEARVLQGETIYRQEFLAEYVSPRDALFNAEWLTDERMLISELPEFVGVHKACISIDPAYTTADYSDYAAVVYCALHGNGTVYVDASIRKRDPETLYWDAHEFWKAHHKVGIVFDCRCLQNFVADTFLSKTNIPHDLLLQIDDRVPKRQRIQRLAKWLSQGKIKILDNADGHLLLDQLRGFPAKEIHDDGPDALEQGISAMTGAYQEI